MKKQLIVPFFIIFSLSLSAQKNECEEIYYIQNNLNRSAAFNNTPILKTKYLFLFKLRKTKLKVSFIKKEDNFIEFMLISGRQAIRNRMFLGTEQPIAFIFNDLSYYIINFKANPLVADGKTWLPFKRKREYNTIFLEDQLLKLLTEKNIIRIEIRNPHQNTPNIVRIFDVDVKNSRELMRIATCFSEAKHSLK